MALLTSSACSSIKIKDFEYCNDIGFQGASCNRFLSDRPRRIAKDEWDDTRFGQFCISGAAYGDIKRELEELCSQNRVQCDYETQEAMQAFFQKVEKLR